VFTTRSHTLDLRQRIDTAKRRCIHQPRSQSDFSTHHSCVCQRV
jgi:hypothetical protein